MAKIWPGLISTRDLMARPENRLQKHVAFRSLALHPDSESASGRQWTARRVDSPGRYLCELVVATIRSGVAACAKGATLEPNHVVA